MGQTSQHAEGLLTQKTFCYPDMACQLVVHLRDNSFTTSYASYGRGCQVHVEDMLFHLLEEKFTSLSSIPEYSKIVFYGHWSPCRLCTDQTIPNNLAKMKIIERNLRVRFRFNHYYTRESWVSQGKGVRPGSGGHYFWESNEAADAAYSRVSNLYGTFPMKPRSTESVVATSTSPRVAFISGLDSSRTVTYWNQNYRGKIWSSGELIA